MDDSEYYAMMRRQYSCPIDVSKKKKAGSSKKVEPAVSNKTPGTFSEWSRKYGHEDAEMFYERNEE